MTCRPPGVHRGAGRAPSGGVDEGYDQGDHGDDHNAYEEGPPNLLDYQESREDQSQCENDGSDTYPPEPHDGGRISYDESRAAQAYKGQEDPDSRGYGVAQGGGNGLDDNGAHVRYR